MNLFLVLIDGDKGRYMDLTPYLNDTKTQNAWEEAKHPRDKDGRFGKGGTMTPAHPQIKPKAPKPDFVSKETRNKISDLYRKAVISDSSAKPVEIGKVSEKTAKEIKNLGFDVAGYSHNLDFSGVRHAIKRHGQGNEKDKNQMPVIESDFLKIPEILETYDKVSYGGKSKIGKDVLKYEKEYSDGTRFYVEEIRTGKKTLTIETMYIHKKKD